MPTVLVVDDNEANRALVKATLEDEGYEVALTQSGEEGLAAFVQKPPDCVLLDIAMPGIDGFEVCARIRALPEGPSTPILFFTALRDVDTFDRALLAGGDDFLTKPIRPTELLVRVQSALKLGRVSAELREHVSLLKQQRDDLLRLQLQKERLTAFVVHDLKNPVNSIDINAQLQLRQKDLSVSAREAAIRIRADAQQLTRMILNLLDVAKADEGKLQPQRAPVSLRLLLEEVEAENRASASGRRVTLRITPSTDDVHADEDLLRRTLTNLVENAIRHTPVDSTVTVRATRLADAMELRVADAGSGIPAALREQIFDPFVQAPASTGQTNPGGRGLGLTFCKLVVEAHGGRIWVEDASPGAVFCIRMPHGP